MSKTFIELSEQEKTELGQIVRWLFDEGSIMKEKIDPRTGKGKNDPRYDQCRIYEDVIRDYLEILSLSLFHEPSYNIFYIKGENETEKKLPRDMTSILLLLRLIYDSKMKEMNLEKPWTTKREIREKGDETRLVRGVMTNEAWKRILGYLKQKNVVVYSGSVGDINDETRIYITEMINVIMNGERIRRLCAEGEELYGEDTEDQPSDTE